MSIRVGEVIGVNGVKIVILAFDESNKESLFHNGNKYKGISIREYISIQRGFIRIVCLVEGEHLDESRIDVADAKVGYLRKVDVRPIGYFLNEEFKEGVKYLPMIKDPAFLLQEEDILAIYGNGKGEGFVIGRMLKEEVPISLPWHKLFNSHVGIFGNTGSGKSNTLAKLFTTLFEKKKDHIGEVSKFVLLDFNGEYTTNQLIDADNKAIYRLNTNNDDGDRFPLRSSEFWNLETLCILFQATQNTQRPFLSRLVDGRTRFPSSEQLNNFVKTVFRRSFTLAAPRPEILDLLRRIASIIEADGLYSLLDTISWHRGQAKFHQPNTNIFFDADGRRYDEVIAPNVDDLDVGEIDEFKTLILRSNLQLCKELGHGFIQFEHIQPLLKRIEASLQSLQRVITVDGEMGEQKLLTVLSLRRCKNDIKKIFPLLIAKHYYNTHKEEVLNPPNKTCHLIIDEAHNILSEQSSREHESWKDYRLELFEELIKEGRKFGVFITIASQRPADISPTIISQIHNFFIHRLINDRDLFLLDNTITTLDAISRGLIPTLAKGCCVVTGTAFDIPMLMQIDQLNIDKQPDSDDVNLKLLWSADRGVNEAQ